MAIKVDGISSEDELKKAQAAAQAQGTSITNYNEWSQILSDFQKTVLNQLVLMQVIKQECRKFKWPLRSM